MTNVFAIIVVTVAGIALGVWRMRGLLRRSPPATVETVHRQLPELRALLLLCAVGTPATALVLKYPWLAWHVPVGIDAWLPAILWLCTGGVFTYLAVITAGVALATRHPKRGRLGFAVAALLAALAYMNVRCSWPAWRDLSPDRDGAGFVYQSTESSCAAASCVNVLKLFGVPASEREMGRIAGTTEHGTRPGQVVRALRAKGLRCRKRVLSVGQLVRLENPAILLVDFPGLGPDSHAVVFRPRGDQPPALIDPLLGSARSLETNSLAACWRGRLIECTRQTGSVIRQVTWQNRLLRADPGG